MGGQSGCRFKWLSWYLALLGLGLGACGGDPPLPAELTGSAGGKADQASLPALQRVIPKLYRLSGSYSAVSQTAPLLSVSFAAAQASGLAGSFSAVLADGSDAAGQFSARPNGDTMRLQLSGDQLALTLTVSGLRRDHLGQVALLELADADEQAGAAPFLLQRELPQLTSVASVAGLAGRFACAAAAPVGEPVELELSLPAASNAAGQFTALLDGAVTPLDGDYSASPEDPAGGSARLQLIPQGTPTITEERTYTLLRIARNSAEEIELLELARLLPDGTSGKALLYQRTRPALERAIPQLDQIGGDFLSVGTDTTSDLIQVSFGDYRGWIGKFVAITADGARRGKYYSSVDEFGTGDSYLYLAPPAESTISQPRNLIVDGVVYGPDWRVDVLELSESDANGRIYTHLLRRMLP